MNRETEIGYYAWAALLADFPLMGCVFYILAGSYGPSAFYEILLTVGIIFLMLYWSKRILVRLMKHFCREKLHRGARIANLIMLLIFLFVGILLLALLTATVSEHALWLAFLIVHPLFSVVFLFGLFMPRVFYSFIIPPSIKS